MFSIRRSAVPPDSLLVAYTTNGCYADAYSTEIVEKISLSEFLLAFYTTPLFKLERLILRFAISKPSTDFQARQLADGDIDSFAAWRVEARHADEILLCDLSGRTRSWLMVTPVETGDDLRTRLAFGSAVVPVQNPGTGNSSLGPVYLSLLKFHQMYSILLLYSAKRKIQQTSRLRARTKELMHE